MSRATTGGASPAVCFTGVGRAGRLTVDSLESIGGLVHAFTLRNSSPEDVLRAVMRPRARLHLLRQVHGATVRVVGRESGPGSSAGSSPEGDALITAQSGVAIGVTVADCVPVLLCDPVRRAIAAVHAGWRGTAAGVLTRTIDALKRRYGSNAEDLRVAIGPAIGPCCYQVGDDVIDALLKYDPGAAVCVRRGDRGRYADLIEANRRQAVGAGVPAARIHAVGLCTACLPDLFWSYRRDRAAAGRMTAFIGWGA